MREMRATAMDCGFVGGGLDPGGTETGMEPTREKMRATPTSAAISMSMNPQDYPDDQGQERQKILRSAALLPQKFLSESHHHSRQPKGEHRE